MKKRLIILRGVPGCGKSTFASFLQETAGAIVCSNDSFLYEDGKYKWSPDRCADAIEKCFYKFEYAVKTSAPLIVIDNTNTNPKYFANYVKIAEENDYEVTYLVVENRHNGINSHNVPQQTLSNMKTTLMHNIQL